MPRTPRNSPNPTGRPPRVVCRRCGFSGRIGKGLSTRGLCPGCSESAMIQAQIDYRRRKGEHYERWRAGVLAWVERDLAEDRILQQDPRSPHTV